MNRRTIVLLGLGLAVAGCRKSPAYEGYFKDHSMHRVIGRIAGAPRIQGAGGSGSNLIGSPHTYSSTYSLVRDREISEELLTSIQKIVLEDMKQREVRVLKEQNAPGSDSNYPTAQVRLRTWGFQILFDDDGWKGAYTVRLMQKEIPEPMLTHMAELWENLVIFPRE